MIRILESVAAAAQIHIGPKLYARTKERSWTHTIRILTEWLGAKKLRTRSTKVGLGNGTEGA